MEISALTGGASAATISQTKFVDDFNQFLTLLTAQLQYQDPLDPIDSNEFVAQLVSFTGVEQSIATNKHLEVLIALNKAGQAASAVGYLGTTIEADGDRIALVDSAAQFLYTLPENTTATSIIIANQSGDIAFVGRGNITVGEHSFEWDGLDADGNPQPDGIYKVTVTGFSSDESLLTIPTVISGRVTGVESVNDSIQLTINGFGVPIEEVRSVVESSSLVP